MDYVYGLIYEAGNFHKGYIGYEEGVIKASGKRISDRIKTIALSSGLIVPTFYNAHVHLADSFLFGQFSDSTVKKLVEPKTGLKMKSLKSANDRTIVDSTKIMIKTMQYSGTSSFIDFRELGARGIELLKKSMKKSPLVSKVLGRPSALRADESELKHLLRVADGIGLSAHCDWQPSVIKKIAEEVKRKNKMFALHVSEVKRENIDRILELEPDFVVHMIEATKSDLGKISDNNIPVVVCPRANMFFGKYPDITAMVNKKIKVMLGTDNSMLSPPSILEELAFAFRCAKLKGGISPQDMLTIVFDNPRSEFEPNLIKSSKPLSTGNSSNFLVFEIPGLYNFSHPENLLCLGLSSSQISIISMKNFIWRRLK